MSLSPAMRRKALALQRTGQTLREIATTLGASLGDVTLCLYGGAESQPQPVECMNAGEQSQPTVQPAPNSFAGMEGGADRHQYAKDETVAETTCEPAGDAIAAVMGKARLANAAGVEPPSADQAPAPAKAIPRHLQRVFGEPLLPQPMQGKRYRLRRADGSWLHESGLTTTTEMRWAWRGTAKQLAAVRTMAFALTRDMVAIEVVG